MTFKPNNTKKDVETKEPKQKDIETKEPKTADEETNESTRNSIACKWINPPALYILNE